MRCGRASTSVRFLQNKSKLPSPLDGRFDVGWDWTSFGPNLARGDAWEIAARVGPSFFGKWDLTINLTTLGTPKLDFLCILRLQSMPLSHY